MQHLDDLAAPAPPRREPAPGEVLGLVAQLERRQRAQHRLGVVRADAPAHPHVGHLQAEVQRVVARGHRPHQQVGAARRVLRQRLDRDVDADRRAAGRGSANGSNATPAPQVLSSAVGTPFARADLDQRRQVRELHRHRARRLEPDQLRLRPDQRRERRRIDRVVEAMRDAPARQLAAREFLAPARRRCPGSAPRRRPTAGRVDEHDRRQAARHQQRLQAALERRDAFLEREGRRRAVQAVGVAGLVLPVARAQRGDVLRTARSTPCAPRAAPSRSPPAAGTRGGSATCSATCDRSSSTFAERARRVESGLGRPAGQSGAPTRSCPSRADDAGAR